MIQWNGDQVQREINQRIDAQANEIGRTVVQIAQRYAPVRTGRMRAGESYEYNATTHQLTFISEAPYDLFVEMGTRHMRPQPHWRPALNTIGPIYGFETGFEYRNVAPIHAPILAQGAGFHLPSTLTEKQRQHVREHLLPTSKRHFIGNVSRAGLKVRHREKF